MRFKVLSLAVLSLVALETTTGTPTSSAADVPDKSAPMVETNVADPSFRASVDDYWTADRMDKAKALDFVVPPDFRASSDAGDIEAGQSISTPASSPPPSAVTSAGPQRAGTEHPFGAAGKLFFKKDGGDYTCSAQFVNRDIILTAAHCLMAENGAWSQNVIFRRGYGAGQYLDSSFYKCASVPKGVALGNTYNWPLDYGFIKTTGPGGGGWFGLQIYTGSNTWTAIGYPSNYSSGQYLMRVPGHRGSSGQVIEMVSNLFGPGASGGAWIEGIYGANFVVGVNSFNHGQGSNMWGPLFDKNFWIRYQSAQSAC